MRVTINIRLNQRPNKTLLGSVIVGGTSQLNHNRRRVDDLFSFSGDSLTSGQAGRDSADAITGYLTDADSDLDIDGGSESKPLSDGLLLIRYLFGFSDDSLISGAIGDEAEQDTAEEVEAYIEERSPVQ